MGSFALAPKRSRCREGNRDGRPRQSRRSAQYPARRSPGSRSWARTARRVWLRFLYAAVALYLSRVTGLCDLILGMPVAARTNSKLRRSTGFVANVLPLATECRSRRDLRRSVQQTGTRIRDASPPKGTGPAVTCRPRSRVQRANIYGVVLNFCPVMRSFEFCGTSGEAQHLHQCESG